jgi:biotin carboxyl carrier protein
MAEQSISADVGGRVCKVEVAEGQSVEAGATLLVIESMKMEIPVESPASGKVLRLLVAEGDMVEEGQALAVMSEG